MGMIARRWSGAVRLQDSDDYEAYLLATGLKDYRKTPGNLGCQLLKRSDELLTHFEITSFWSDEASIKAFAGDDVRKAVYYPMDRHYLVEMADEVDHFEVAFVEAAPTTEH